MMKLFFSQLLGILVFVFIFFSKHSMAMCLPSYLDGQWINIENHTNGITKVEIQIPCNDTIINGELSNKPATIQIWESCSSTDCKKSKNILLNLFWDDRKQQLTYAEVLDKKNYATTRLKIYLIDKNNLQIISLTDFIDSNNLDYSNIYYFKK